MQKLKKIQKEIQKINRKKWQVLFLLKLKFKMTHK